MDQADWNAAVGGAAPAELPDRGGSAVERAWSCVRLRRWLTRARAARRLERINRGSAALEDAVIEPGRASLVAELLRACRAINDGPDEPSAAVVSAIAAASAAAPESFSLRAALADAHIRLGLTLARDPAALGEAAAHLSRAGLINPIDPDPPELIDRLKTLLDQLGTQLVEARDQGQQLTFEGDRILRLHLQGLERYLVKVASSEGARLVAASLVASEMELSQKLGLGSGPEGQLAARDLVKMADSSPGDHSFAELRRRCIDARPELAQAPWEAIDEVFQAGLAVSVHALALLLPAPPLPAEEQARCWSRRAWMLSSRDWPLKLCVAAGVVLLALAVARGVSGARQEHRCDRASQPVFTQSPEPAVYGVAVSIDRLFTALP